MHKLLYRILYVALIVTAHTAARAAEEEATDAERERQLIDVLLSDAPAAEKAITCKHLAVHGTADAVPSLRALLSDKELASWARIALEAIPDPAADAALLEAVENLEGRLLVGTINSIGARRDPHAVGALSLRLEDGDPAVASAAAVALGRIGNALATKTLEQALTVAPTSVRSAVAEGCIYCAEKLVVQGKATEAAKLYDEVRQSDVPKSRILEATRGAILARQSAGIPLLVEQLESADKASFAIGLSTARELSGDGVTEALVGQLSKATPDRRGPLMLVLADRGDTTALPAVLQATTSGPNQVRIAAMRVLDRLGNGSCVPTLLEIALEAEEEVALAAKMALEGLSGEEVDVDLVVRLSQAEGRMRQLVIELVGQRRIKAIPALLKAANDSDAQIRAAAITSLGSTVGPEDLSVLIRRVVAPPNAEDTVVAVQALRAAAVRMPDRDACAEELVVAMSQAPVSAKCSILEILGAMGGAKALQTVGAAVKGTDPEMLNTASRLLGEWMTADAAEQLLDLAKGAPEAKYRVRALRGYIRIARQFSMPDDERAEMCRTALLTASRDDEKKLVLVVLERYPNMDMFKLAVEAIKDPSLKNDAEKIAMAIVQKIDDDSIDVQELLAQVGHDPLNVEIIKAEYGMGADIKDVTETLRERVRGFPLIALPTSSYNSSFGGDPAPGIAKQLKVQYRIDGKSGDVSFPEDAPIMLPIPK